MKLPVFCTVAATDPAAGIEGKARYIGAPVRGNLYRWLPNPFHPRTGAKICREAACSDGQRSLIYMDLEVQASSPKLLLLKAAAYTRMGLCGK